MTNFLERLAQTTPGSVLRGDLLYIPDAVRANVYSVLGRSGEYAGTVVYGPGVILGRDQTEIQDDD